MGEEAVRACRLSSYSGGFAERAGEEPGCARAFVIILMFRFFSFLSPRGWSRRRRRHTVPLLFFLSSHLLPSISGFSLCVFFIGIARRGNLVDDRERPRSKKLFLFSFLFLCLHFFSLLFVMLCLGRGSKKCSNWIQDMVNGVEREMMMGRREREGYGVSDPIRSFDEDIDC